MQGEPARKAAPMWDGLTDGEQSIPHDSVLMRTPYGALMHIHHKIAPLVKMCWELGIRTTQSFQGIEEHDASWRYLAQHEPDYLALMQLTGTPNAYLQFPTERDALAFLNALGPHPSVVYHRWTPGPGEREYFALSLADSDQIHKVEFPPAHLPEITRRFNARTSTPVVKFTRADPQPLNPQPRTTATSHATVDADA